MFEFQQQHCYWKHNEDCVVVELTYSNMPMGCYILAHCSVSHEIQACNSVRFGVREENMLREGFSEQYVAKCRHNTVLARSVIAHRF